LLLPVRTLAVVVLNIITSSFVKCYAYLSALKPAHLHAKLAMRNNVIKKQLDHSVGAEIYDVEEILHTWVN